MYVRTLLTALFFAASLLLPVAACAQPEIGGESYDAPPPTAAEPAVSDEQSEQEQSTVSDTPASESPPPLERSQETTEAVDESIPLATSKPAQQQALISNTAVVGATVKNLQGEKLGSIRELMIDPQTGRVVYAVVVSRGFLGVGEKSLAIPWETLRVGFGQNELIVEMDKNKLQITPTYEMSQR